MPPRPFSVLAALIAVIGCSPDVPEGRFVCQTDRDCPPTMGCGLGRCYTNPPRCSAVCGDVDGNGVFDDADLLSAWHVVNGDESNRCAQNATDVDANGMLDGNDVRALKWSLCNKTCFADPPADTCAECPPICGDVNLDGSFDEKDPAFVDTPQVKYLCACQPLAADVNVDGVIDPGDVNAMQAALDNRGVPPACGLDPALPPISMLSCFPF